MKRLYNALLVAAGFFLIAAPIYMQQPNPVFVNGNHHLGDALTINGIIAVSVDDLSKVVGGTVRVQGNHLSLTAPTLQASAVAGSSFNPAGAAGGGGTGHSAASAAGGAGGATQVNSIGSATGGAGVGKIRFNPFTIKKTVDNASPVLFSEGKAYVSLTEVARLFGGSFNNAISGNLKPGQRIDLTIAPNPGATIAVGDVSLH